MNENYLEKLWNSENLENLNCSECKKKAKPKEFKVNSVCKNYEGKDTNNIIVICSECNKKLK